MNSFALDVLNPLVRGTSLEREEARSALSEILEGRVDGVLIASFLTALTAKGETAEEMTGFIDAMIEAATTFSIGPDAIDVVGTGSFIPDSWHETYATADIVDYGGVPMVKVGREFLLRKNGERKRNGG